MTSEKIIFLLTWGHLLLSIKISSVIL